MRKKLPDVELSFVMPLFYSFSELVSILFRATEKAGLSKEEFTLLMKTVQFIL